MRLQVLPRLPVFPISFHHLLVTMETELSGHPIRHLFHNLHLAVVWIVDSAILIENHVC